MLRPKYTGLCTDCNRKSHKGSGNPNWKNGQRIGGQDDKYILNYAPEHPQADSKGYVLAHRLVGEEMLGRPLYPEEVPHHLDFNPQINDPSNIIILSNQASHVKLHKYLAKIALIERAETLKEIEKELFEIVHSRTKAAAYDKAVKLWQSVSGKQD